VRQTDYRELALTGRARPGSNMVVVTRPRLEDGDPAREAAFKLAQDALDEWAALPDDIDPKALAAARDALREALGILGAVTGRAAAPSPYVGRRPVVAPSAGVAALLR
jgi:hypothetical protein